MQKSKCQGYSHIPILYHVDSLVQWGFAHNIRYRRVQCYSDEHKISIKPRRHVVGLVCI